LSLPRQFFQAGALGWVIDVIEVEHESKVTGPGRRFPRFDTRQRARRDPQPVSDIFQPQPPGLPQLT
jgi:hypothetical protein